MAYTHSKYEVIMQPATVSQAAIATTLFGSPIDATGIQAYWACGYVPHLIRGFAVVRADTNAVSAAPNAVFTIGFEANISSPSLVTRVATINVPAGASIAHGSCYYTPTYDIEMEPGMLMIARATAAATAAEKAAIILYVEPRWEVPGNVTAMQLTT
jgi:hypothetical protein|tara:strand:+ start:2459 stop:2929 length:471 start_codon:yes stop_codon:yes gene_type:complete